MTPIRPNAILAQPPASPAASRAGEADAARAAAQRAFFDAAMGRSAAPATPQAAAAVRPATFAPTSAPLAPRAAVAPDLSQDIPAKILRPGSLLDIKV